MLNLYQLDLFVAVAEASSLSAAAEEHHLSQSAVSRQIKALERTWHVDLFTRRGNRLEPTPEAQRILPIVRELVRLGRLADELIAAIRSGSQATPDAWEASARRTSRVMASTTARMDDEIRLGCGTAYDHRFLRLVGKLREYCPELTLRTEHGPPDTLIQKVRGGSLDFAFVGRRPRERGLRSRRLAGDFVGVVLPSDHPWAGRTAISAADLIGAPFILQSQESDQLRLIEEALGQCGIQLQQLRAVIVVDNARDAIEAVALGLGITFASQIFAQRASSNIVVVPLEGAAIRWEIALVHRPEDQLSPVGRRLEGFLRSPLATKLLAGED